MLSPRILVDELAAGVVALALAAASILLATSEVRAEPAEPVIVKAELVLYPSAVQVVRECMARNGSPPPMGHGVPPSCFRGDAQACTIIAMQPDDSEANLGPAVLLGREVNNCARGAHKFAVNPE
ncbi:MAG: hypothetical protein HMLKMBBP_01499 [Planctomycetes bacterium]|nr:hypothetical protein [Planctomycetota bacterium]